MSARFDVVDGTAAERWALTAWSAWGAAAMFYAYAFLQRVAPSVMVDDLMRDLTLDGAALGTLSAAYFYTYAAVQIPGGVVMDRFGPRRLLTAAALVTACGSLLFAVAGGFGTALAGRALIGLGVGFAYLGSLKLANSWFPAHRYALFVGLTLMLGLSGAIAGQAPLAALVAVHGWRTLMVVGALVALGIAVAILLLVRDRPEGQAPPAAGGSLRIVLRRRQLWLLAAVACLFSGPLLTFGGLWGVPYLVQVHGLSKVDAGMVTSAMLAAWALGGPAAGWASDRIGRRKPLMLVGGAVSIAAWLALLLPAEPPLPLVMLLCVLIGAAAGPMVIAFAQAGDLFGGRSAASAAGVVNTAVLLLGAGLQTLVGRLLDLRWDGTLHAGARIYAADDFRFGFAVLALAAVLQFCATAALRETWCRPDSRA